MFIFYKIFQDVKNSTQDNIKCVVGMFIFSRYFKMSKTPHKITLNVLIFSRYFKMLKTPHKIALNVLLEGLSCIAGLR